jgi:hypothetical protein
MAEQPKLPAGILRLHSLRWNELIEKDGFTGEHLKWHESPDRRRQAARPRFSLAPPPATDIRDRMPSKRTHDGTDGQPVPYEKWLEQQMAEWVARESDPSFIDSIGVAATVDLAKARFSQIIMDYLKFWATSTHGNSDEFRDWSIGIVQSVAGEVGDLWRKDPWHSDWFERACHKKIGEALEPLRKGWEGRASKLEIQQIENPYLSLESLLSADGNLSVSSTFEDGKKAILAAQQVLSRLHATEPVRQVNEATEAPEDTPDTLIANMRAVVEPVLSKPLGELAAPEHAASQPRDVVETAVAKVPRRTPDIEKSRERLAFFDSVATELATIKQDLKGYYTAKSLKQSHPKFVLWKLISKKELQEIVNGETFFPRTFAENLTLRKFGITSRETLKKDRYKIRRVE